MSEGESAAPDQAAPGAHDAVTALVPLLEAVLFACGEPIRVSTLAQAIEVDESLVDAALERLEASLRGRHAGLMLARVAGGVQLRTHPRFAEAVFAVVGGRPQRLSRAALEVLAIVAYQQPVTRGDVEEVRGVACGAVLRHLLERGLLRVSGRRDVPGRPLEYATTSGFLELFGLDSLKDLPTLAERAELEDA